MPLLGINTTVDHIYDVEFWSGAVVSFNGHDNFKSEVRPYKFLTNKNALLKILYIKT